MRCPVCDGKDWKNVDELRLKPENMEQCQGCGFISYPKSYKSEKEIIEYYKNDYRPAPQVANLFTGERKLQYHAANLKNLFDQWKKEGKTKPVIGEVGAAYGLLMNWIKQIFPEAEVHGTELTQTFKRVGWHEFNLNIEDELPKDTEFDLIISYHVLEHQMDPDKKLKEYADMLKDDGVFYLSCPVWFRDATNSAVGGFDIEYYYHPDHINVWSPEHLQWIIHKAGLAMTWKNDCTYGDTYLLEKTAKSYEQPKFEKKKYYDIAENIYKSWKFIQENKTKEAIEAYPNCPAAWINHYEHNRKKYHEDQEEFAKFIKDSTDICVNSADMLIFCADILSRYERYDDSQKLLEKAVKIKINNPSILFGIANCFRGRAKKLMDQKAKDEQLKNSISVLRFIMSTSTEMMPQAITWAYHDESLLSSPID